MLLAELKSAYANMVENAPGAIFRFRLWLMANPQQSCLHHRRSSLS